MLSFPKTPRVFVFIVCVCVVCGCAWVWEINVLEYSQICCNLVRLRYWYDISNISVYCCLYDSIIILLEGINSIDLIPGNLIPISFKTKVYCPTLTFNHLLWHYDYLLPYILLHQLLPSHQKGHSLSFLPYQFTQVLFLIALFSLLSQPSISVFTHSINLFSLMRIIIIIVV